MCWRPFCYCLILGLLLAGCAGTSRQTQKDQQQAQFHYKLGVSHLQGNNPTLALKELLLAAQGDPQNSAIQAVLAQAYQLKKAYQDAERHYLKALELSHNDPRYQNNLGALYLDMQQWDKAIEYFDKAATNLMFLSPQVAIAGKGYAYFKKMDLDSALLHYQEAIAIAPGYARAHFLLSEVYREQGKAGLELRSLERAVAVAPQYVEAHYQLGTLLLKQQQREQASQHFQKVMELAPSSEWGQKATDMLRAMGK
jgi:Tfp pilus assembly protein PilF